MREGEGGGGEEGEEDEEGGELHCEWVVGGGGRCG